MTSHNTNRRTFKPTIRERQILAGGMTLFEVDDEGRVVFDDSLRDRCGARGTRHVPVDVLELMEVLLAHYRQQSW